MHTYQFFFFLFIDINCVWYFSVCFSLSSFQLVALWHLNISTLRPKTLFILGCLLLFPLLILHPLTFSSMMRMPIRTSWRTLHGIHSEHQVVLSDFSYTDLPIVIYSRGWGPLCGIPVTSVQIWFFCTSLHHSCSRYAHCSHSGSHIRGATRTEGSTSWLPRLWSS